MEGDKLLKANTEIKYHKILNQIASKLSEIIKKEAEIDTTIAGKQIIGDNINVNVVGNITDNKTKHEVELLMQKLGSQGNFEALVKPKV